MPGPASHKTPCSRKAAVGWTGRWRPGCPACLLPQRGEGLAWGATASGMCGEAEAVSPEAFASFHSYNTMPPRPWNVLQLTKRRKWQPTPLFSPGKSHGQRSLVGYSPWGCKSRTRLSDFTLTFHFHAMEKEMATHSSILAWKIPWTEEPGRLQSMAPTGLPSKRGPGLGSF